MGRARKRVIVWVSALLLVVSAFAGQAPAAHGGAAAIRGSVRNSVGHAQMGATVEIFAAGTALRAIQTTFTDQNGNFSIAGLLPGRYFVRVSAPAFLPSMRERVTLASGTHLILNFTLNTLFEAQRLIPELRNSNSPEDDWQWTLRSAANRPVLRVFDGQPTVVSSEAAQRDSTSAKLAFLAGGGFDGLGGMPSVTTNFTLQQDIGARALSFTGSAGYGGRDPDGMLRVAFARREGEPGVMPDVALIVRRTSVETPRFAGSTFSSFGVEFSQITRLLDAVDMRYGAVMETASVGPQVVFEPFLDAAYKIGKDSRITYRHRWSGSDHPPDDQQEYAPRLTVKPNGLAVERARHQELGYERKLSGNLITVAYYRDAISNLALSGIGQMSAAGPDFSDAILAGNDLESFTTNAGRLHTQGMRVAWQRKIGDAITVGAHYSYGTVLDADMARYAVIAELAPALETGMRHAAGADVKTKIHHGSQIEASYNVTVGSALTPVDQFAGNSIADAPFMNLRWRQPLPSFMPAHMEALIDIRNLLAQGYRPVLGEDGRTLYLVQAARSLRGGIAFTF